MRHLFQYGVVLILCILTTAGDFSAAAEPESRSFALVELFTSEGCSSCPPADQLLNDLAADARKEGKPVYCLAFHVDYWDYLGWKDSFSDQAYTRRQHAYAAALGSSGIYTPQMVVNGREGFVGSDQGKALSEIRQALAHPARTAVSVQANRSPVSGDVQVIYEVSAAPRGAVLCAALTEDGFVVPVTAGENARRTLRHDAVVRAFESLPLKEMRGTLHLRPVEPIKGRARVVVYVQDSATLEVFGAAAAGGFETGS